MKKPQTARDDDLDLAFDPVEDINDDSIPDESSFDRALKQLLPEDAPGRRGGGGSHGLDIDLDDFEAFNRELDARLQDVRDLRPLPGREPVVDDLGDEAIEALPAARAPSAAEEVADREERYEPLPVPLDEPAEDVVTLASVAPAGAPAPTPPSEKPLAPPVASPAGQPSAARSLSAAVATLIGVLGLAAAAASLWLVLDKEAEVQSLTARLDAVDRQLAKPLPITGPDPAVQNLEANLKGLAQRVDSALAVERGSDPEIARSIDTVGERLSQIERSMAELKAPAITPAAAPPAPAALPATPAAATAPPKPAAPPSPAAADTAATKKPVAPAPKPVRKPLPEPGRGPWTVIIESFASDRDAERRLTTLEKSGIPAEIRPVEIDGQLWHRVVVTGYETQDAAKSVAADLRTRKIGSPWVVRSGD
jgi:cell division septation protein DedD